MTDDLRTRIAAVFLDWCCKFEDMTDADRSDMADAVMEVITVHIPPIVASAIHSYADSEIMAMSYHGEPSDLAAMEKLNKEAAQIANYATKHERWNRHVK